MQKKKNDLEGSQNKEKASTIAESEEAFNKQSLDADATSDLWEINTPSPIDPLESMNPRRSKLATKPLPELRNWSMIENFRRSLANAVTTQPVLFDLNKPQPVTTRQINYLVKLYHRTGKKEFARIKNDLGITHKVPDLTRHEASVLIKALKKSDQQQKSRLHQAQQRPILESG